MSFLKFLLFLIHFCYIMKHFLHSPAPFPAYLSCKLFFVQVFVFFFNLGNFMVVYYLLMLQFLSKPGKIKDSFNQITT